MFFEMTAREQTNLATKKLTATFAMFAAFAKYVIALNSACLTVQLLNFAV